MPLIHVASEECDCIHIRAALLWRDERCCRLGPCGTICCAAQRRQKRYGFAANDWLNDWLPVGVHSAHPLCAPCLFPGAVQWQPDSKQRLDSGHRTLLEGESSQR